MASWKCIFFLNLALFPIMAVKDALTSGIIIKSINKKRALFVFILILSTCTPLLLLSIFPLHISAYNTLQSLILFTSITPNAPEAIDAPNILFLFPDEWRFDWLDDYYHVNLSLHMPHTQRLISRGTRFMNVVSASPACVPSRACLAAGREYDDLMISGNNNDWPKKQRTFYQKLQQYGYHTMVSGKDDLTKQHGVGSDGSYRLYDLGFNAQRRCKGKMDIDHKHPNHDDPFSNYLASHFIERNNTNVSYGDVIHQCYKSCINYNNCPIPCELEQNNVDEMAYHDHWITMNTLDLLEEKPKDTPWFLQVNFAGPHPPFMITRKMYNDSCLHPSCNRSFPLPMNYTEFEDVAAKRKNAYASRPLYSASVEYLDVKFGKIIHKLMELGEFHTTIICIASDHGDLLGDADDMGKFKPWIQSTNVPLICSGPGILTGNTVHSHVELIDLAATFLDFAQSQNATNNVSTFTTNEIQLQNMTALSLRPFMNGSWSDDDHDGYRKYMLSGYNTWRVVIKEINETCTWKYIRSVQESSPPDIRLEKNWNSTTKLTQLLYNIIEDPYEHNNVVHKHPEVVEELSDVVLNNLEHVNCKTITGVNKSYCRQKHIFQ